MSRRYTSIDAAYFEALYAREADPWKFATSDYEREKYAATLAALPTRLYEAGLEIGCSIGVFTAQLARRCDTLLAIDLAANALAAARERCADIANVSFAQMRVPGQWPEGPFDLILLSEVVYYLDRADVTALAARVEKTASPGAIIILVHWLGLTDYPLTGDDAADLFIRTSDGFAAVSYQSRTADYRLDVLRVGLDRRD
jgi:SAM-dependent methyltransferase